MKAIKIAVCALVTLVAALPAAAEPVTLAFEAEIVGIVQPSPFNSGIEANIGDEIFGKFTFEPSQETGLQSLDLVQNFPAVLQFGGVTFTTPMNSRDLTLRATDDGGAADAPFSIADSISVGSTITPRNPGVLPNITSGQSSFRISLFGTPTIFDGASHPRDVAIWNSFTFDRFMSVNIRGTSGETLAYGARVGQFTVVPEPPTIAASCLTMLALLPVVLRANN